MHLFQLFNCIAGRHHRDGRKAELVGKHYRSVCKGCGRRMIQDRGNWRLVRKSDG